MHARHPTFLGRDEEIRRASAGRRYYGSNAISSRVREQVPAACWSFIPVGYCGGVPNHSLDCASASGRGSPSRMQGLPGGLGKTNCVKDAKEAMSDIGVRLGTPSAAERSYSI
jgi:hypothetical protein